MGTLLDLASLVVVPSGYKEDKLYSVKPTDGSGDLDFTRSNDTATRVNSAGLIEKVRTNLVLQSNTFDTTWAAIGSSVTSGQAGYDGTTNAWLLTKSAGSGRVEQSLSTLSNASNTLSVYVKANTSTWCAIEYSTSYRYLNLSTGAVSSGGGGYNVQSVGNGWYRFSINSSSASATFRIYPAEADDIAATTGSVFIQNAQVETGDIATDYIPTTTTALSVGMTANVPRLDYSGGGCPKLKLEPQRTNLVTYSEQFDNAAWNTTRATITANQAVAPDGTTTADLFTDGTFTNTNCFSDQGISTSGTYNMSGFVKAGTSPFIALILYDTQDNGVLFNTSTQTITTFGTVTNEKVESFGNGWYRISFARTVSAATSFAGISVRPTNSIGPYNGTSSLTALFWGVQVEAGSYATSYIPTLSAAVTRGADACFKTGISSLIGQTEGTMFVDFNWEQKSGVFFINSISDGSTGNEIFMAFGSTADNAIRFSIVAASTGYVSTDSAVLSSGRYKIAFAYANNDATAYINGVQIFTDTSAIIPATSEFKFQRANNTLPFIGSVNQQILFPTRLTNTQLAEITTI